MAYRPHGMTLRRQILYLVLSVAFYGVVLAAVAPV
jgi:hypothetical protein